ncbi:UNKNOWN [Stylonychia lemnae]|uniref:Uncharacterized protein n=1 Tax=Stylonychia lemnae TaxID=5949 RepID=A0A078AR65_STYLE|nr:UNKNOWN [Stylonychia lemnae]|eukprot:CDW83368.1 UNKNOWN [Stylonychia lemnae]
MLLAIRDGESSISFMMKQNNNQRFEFIKRIQLRNVCCYITTTWLGLKQMDYEYFMIMTGNQMIVYETKIPEYDYINELMNYSYTQVLYNLAQTVEIQYEKHRTQNVTYIAQTSVQSMILKLYKLEKLQTMGQIKFKCTPQIEIKIGIVGNHTLMAIPNMPEVVLIVGDIQQIKMQIDRNELSNYDQGIKSVNIKTGEIRKEKIHKRIKEINQIYLYENFMNNNYVSQILWSTRYVQNKGFQVATFHLDKELINEDSIRSDLNFYQKPSKVQDKHRYRGIFGYLKQIQVNKDTLIVIEDEKNNNRLKILRLKFE